MVRRARGGREPGPPGEVGPEPRGLRLAPRTLPRALVWRLVFGDSLAAFGWLFAAFGMGFVLVFLPMIDLRFAAHDRHASATLTSIEQTGSSENDRRIYQVRYTFVDEAGVSRTGESFTTDPPAELGAWPVGYRGSDPSQSLLGEMRHRQFSPLFVFVLVFPLVGLALVISQLPAARRNLRLLRHGAPTRGKLVHRRATRVEINETPVIALTFEYEVAGTTHSSTVKTLTPGPLEDDELEPMLYDPRAPGCATTLDHLPGSPKITGDGELEARPGFVLHLLISPLVFAGLLAATVIRMI